MKHEHVYPNGIEIRRELELVTRSSDPVDVACGVALRLFEKTDDVWGLRSADKSQESLDEDRMYRLKRSMAEADLVLAWARGHRNEHPHAEG